MLYVFKKSSFKNYNYAYHIQMPYLHWDSFENLKARARVIRKRMAQSSARPVDRNIAYGTSIEHKLIWQYLTSHRPLHCRRTLDQYGYPSLRKTAVRDADQILYKRTKVDKDTEPPPTAGTKHSVHGSLSRNHDPLIDSEQEKGAKVLMVDQLWLWIVDDRKPFYTATLISLYTTLGILHNFYLDFFRRIFANIQHRNCGHFRGTKREGR